MKDRGRQLLTFFILGSVLAFGQPNFLAGQTKHLTTDELSKQSEVVAVGKVSGLKSQWDKNKSRIVTQVTMTVGEYLKGNAGGEITITSPGGEVDGVGEWYSHSPRFKNSEDVVVFARRDKEGHYRVAGGHEGKFSVKKDAVTGKQVVDERGSLDDFKSQIKKAVLAHPGN
jgi:hypothetical protein